MQPASQEHALLCSYISTSHTHTHTHATYSSAPSYAAARTQSTTLCQLCAMLTSHGENGQLRWQQSQVRPNCRQRRPRRREVLTASGAAFALLLRSAWPLAVPSSPPGYSLVLPLLPADLLLVESSRGTGGARCMAIALVGEPGCPSTVAALSEDLALWGCPSPDPAGEVLAHRSGGPLVVKGRRTLGFRHVRARLLKVWDRGELLVSCYTALRWLRTGLRPSRHELSEPPKAADVANGLQRMAERPSSEASDEELCEWVGSEYGTEGRRRLMSAAFSEEKEEFALKELRAFFTWFRERFPYYRGACDGCGSEDTHFLGVVRPSETERAEGGAAVSELYACAACGNKTTLFPRFRRVRPVLRSHRGRCGEYAWMAVRLLEALGYQARWVDNHSGHVWAEVRVAGRWVHVDPCEAAVDMPLLYAEQWGNCPRHVLAYDGAAVEVVTDRYRPPGADEVPEATRKAVDGAVAGALSTASAKEPGSKPPGATAVLSQAEG
ncbi:unnamed protein product, partial [Polarella glacialis]